jgi:hypothetical protein
LGPPFQVIGDLTLTKLFYSLFVIWMTLRGFLFPKNAQHSLYHLRCELWNKKSGSSTDTQLPRSIRFMSLGQ